ncbi:MAG: leucine-rich repeat domain-containing protein, partial [Muribaculaceae bacterium]|nr:leucine-rich repeat domain-containing protein [Muribaculaceae bacterium]
MRKVLSLVVVAAFAFNASAMIYKCDKFNTSKKTCRLIGWSGNQPTSGKLKLPSSFKHTDEITYTITTVEEHALDNLTEVTEITIPAVYTKIGNISNTYVVNSTSENFNNCPNLKLFKVEAGSPIVEATADGVLYLKGRKELLNVPAKYETITGFFTVPEECKNISRDAFAGNSTIHTIGLGRDVEIFDNGGLNRMAMLGKIQLITAATNDLSLNFDVLIYKNRIVSCPPAGGMIKYTIPDAINEISPYAFYDSRALSEIKIPSSVKKIGDNAFGHTGLESLTIPASVENYGKKMVAECQSLERVKFESRLPMISDRFAENCSKLAVVESASPIVKVGESAFKNCRALKTFPFRGETVLSEDSSFYNTGLEKVVFEESLITDYFSGENLFANCRDLKEIDFSRLIMEYVDADLAIGPGY